MGYRQFYGDILTPTSLSSYELEDSFTDLANRARFHSASTRLQVFVFDAGIGLNEAGINRKAIATDQAFGQTTLHDSLEEMTQNVSLAEAPIAVQRES